MNLPDKAGRKTSAYLDSLSKSGNTNKGAERVMGERVRQYGWQPPEYVPYCPWQRTVGFYFKR